MLAERNRLKTILLYSVSAFFFVLVAMWGYRAIAQELFYQTRYYHLVYRFLLCGSMTIAIVIGITWVAAIIAFLHEHTDSYLPIFPVLIAAMLALYLPLQASPEVRHFLKHREDYEAIVQLWQNGQISSDTPTSPCLDGYRAIVQTINDRQYCVRTGFASVSVFVFNPYIVMLYRENPIDPYRENPCTILSPYGAFSEAQVDYQWNLCGVDWRSY